MVSYFRLQSYLFMALGAAAGILAAVLGLGSVIANQVTFIRLFIVMLFALAGVVLGRLFASVWANKRMSALNAILYQRCDPQGFLRQFTPIAAKAPEASVEHIDGQVKIAYAHEALGEFDEGLQALDGLKPELLRLHSLQCSALIANQRLRLYLLKEDITASEEALGVLRSLKETSEKRVPTLSRNLGECIRLGENWLAVLQHEDCDLDYLREEIRLSQNRIHKSEVQLLLGRALELGGADLDAKEAYLEAVETLPDLYAGKAARTAYDSYGVK